MHLFDIFFWIFDIFLLILHIFLPDDPLIRKALLILLNEKNLLFLCPKAVEQQVPYHFYSESFR